jgi:GNAT superfamily N-acetyltransferase
MAAQPQNPQEIIVRSLRESDLTIAEGIRRIAFGTFLNVADPTTFRSDINYVRTRWLADPNAAFGAELEGQLVGSNLATRWGSVGFFGPLTVHPDLWNRGIATRLMKPVMELFETWGITHAGLFTFAQSPAHIHLYQKFGFWPRFLTAIMSKVVTPPVRAVPWLRYSRLQDSEQKRFHSACREVTEAIYPGLDMEREIRAVNIQKLGDTVLLVDDAKLLGLAVCHCGRGTEAGDGNCYVKFGGVRPGADAARHFEQLLDACEALAALEGMATLVAGVNTGRQEAYRTMMAHGFRTNFQGVAMHKPNEPGYNRRGVYLIDDWR